MENSQPVTESLDHADGDAHAPAARRPFVEPTLTPAGDVFDVTRRYLFMMMASGAGEEIDDNVP